MSARARTVLVTRPQPGAAQSERRLREAGFEPIVVPLTEVVAVKPALHPQNAARAEAVVVTSANGIRFAPEALLQTLMSKPVYTVGEATATVARERGFQEVRSADGAVDELVALVSREVRQGAGLVYLAGQRRTGDLDGKLCGAGLSVEIAEIYHTKQVSQLTEKLDRVFSDDPPAAVLFHSAFSSRLFTRYASAQSIDQTFENALYFAISERVAAPLPAAWNDRIRVARRPTDDALMALLESQIDARQA